MVHYVSLLHVCGLRRIRLSSLFNVRSCKELVVAKRPDIVRFVNSAYNFVRNKLKKEKEKEINMKRIIGLRTSRRYDR